MQIPRGPKKSFRRPLIPRYDPSQPDHVVLETFQRGYRYGNESLRPAKVVVNDHSMGESAANLDTE